MDDLGYPRFRNPPYVVRVGYTYIFSRVTLGVVTMFDVLSTSVKIVFFFSNKHRGSSPSAMTYKAQKCFDDASKVQFREEKCEDLHIVISTHSFASSAQQSCTLQSAKCHGLRGPVEFPQAGTFWQCDRLGLEHKTPSVLTEKSWVAEKQPW